MSEALNSRFDFASMPQGLANKRVTESMDLRGKVAVIAGGGGRNLGRSCVDRLASLGATVVAIDLDGDAAIEAAAAAAQRWGVESSSGLVNMTDWLSVSAAAQAIVKRHGGIDIWVNSVGNPTMAARFQDLDPKYMRADVERNLLSAMFGARAAIDAMLPRGKGRIINIASDAGRIGMPMVVAYSSAKAGVIGFTRSLAYDLRGTGVTVAGVSPGMTISPALLEVLAQIPAELEESIHFGLDRTIATRAGLVEEVANMVAFIATEAGAYVVGSTLPVSGGLGD